MLKQILLGSKISNFVIIYDSIAESGLSLLKASVHGHLCKKNNILLYCFETDVESMFEALDCKNHDLVLGYDGFSDPLKWVGKDETFRSIKTNQSFCEAIRDDMMPDSENNILIIDSLSNAILFHDVHDVCRELNSIKFPTLNTNATIRQVVALVHKDMCEDITVALFNHVATTIISTISSNSDKPMVHITHKTASGKVTSLDNYYWFDQSGVLQVEDVLKVTEHPKLTNKDETVIKSLTTFKLSLDDTEKVARSRVVLPYLSARNKQKESIIEYEPDPNDDWDDEDPDDDLDI